MTTSPFDRLSWINEDKKKGWLPGCDLLPVGGFQVDRCLLACYNYGSSSSNHRRLLGEWMFLGSFGRWGGSTCELSLQQITTKLLKLRGILHKYSSSKFHIAEILQRVLLWHLWNLLMTSLCQKKTAMWCVSELHPSGNVATWLL